MIAVCVLLTKPRPKVRVRVNWRHMKKLVSVLLNPGRYAAEICFDIGVKEVGSGLEATD